MDDKFDSTSWTGDTSHRDPEFTPEAKVIIVKALGWVAVAITMLLAGTVILKGLM